MTLTKYNANGEVMQDEARFAPQAVVFSAFRGGASQALSANTETAILFQNKDFDPFSWYDPTTGRFTPKVAGYYDVSASLIYQTLAAGNEVECRLRKNGVTQRRTQFTTAGSQWQSAPLSAILYANGSTDYFDIAGWSSAGSAMSGANNSDAFFSAELVAASVGVAPEPWHMVGATGEPAFKNGWANYASASYAKAGFFKDPHGIVHLLGLVSGGTANAGAAMFTLPAGYRPAIELILATGSNSVYGRVDIVPNGDVVANTPTSNVWVALDGLTFRAEQ